MNFTSLHHIAIICSDYEKSKHFYTNVMKFKVIKETYRPEKKSYKLDLKINDTLQLELFSYVDAPKRHTYPEACGLRHIAFQVEDVDETVRYLQSQNIRIEDVRVDNTTGKKFTFLFDPDKQPIEIYGE